MTLQSPRSSEIRKARKDAGLTQDQAAELVHVTLNGWHKWEAGTRMMPPGLWELFLIKTKQVVQSRKIPSPPADGSEPVRVWLLHEVSAEARRGIGGDIKTVQLGWPLGMPLVRKMDARLWEVRSYIPEGIARVFFTTHEEYMVLLHGIVKKSDKTPKADLQIAKDRRKEVIK